MPESIPIFSTISIIIQMSDDSEVKDRHNPKANLIRRKYMGPTKKRETEAGKNKSKIRQMQKVSTKKASIIRKKT